MTSNDDRAVDAQNRTPTAATAPDPTNGAADSVALTRSLATVGYGLLALAVGGPLSDVRPLLASDGGRWSPLVEKTMEDLRVINLTETPQSSPESVFGSVDDDFSFGAGSDDTSTPVHDTHTPTVPARIQPQTSTESLVAQFAELDADLAGGVGTSTPPAAAAHPAPVRLPATTAAMLAEIAFLDE